MDPVPPEEFHFDIKGVNLLFVYHKQIVFWLWICPASSTIYLKVRFVQFKVETFFKSGGSLQACVIVSIFPFSSSSAIVSISPFSSSSLSVSSSLIISIVGRRLGCIVMYWFHIILILFFVILIVFLLISIFLDRQHYWQALEILPQHARCSSSNDATCYDGLSSQNKSCRVFTFLLSTFVWV